MRCITLGVAVCYTVFGPNPLTCVLQCVAVYCSVLQCVAVNYSALHHFVCCSMLHCVASLCNKQHLLLASECCTVLQSVAACCSVLQRAAACCSVLQRVAICHSVFSVLQCVLQRVLQRVAYYCSVLQSSSFSKCSFALRLDFSFFTKDSIMWTVSECSVNNKDKAQ